MRSRLEGFREAMKIVVPVLLLLAGGVWLALKFSDPAPPGTFVISTASTGSPYHRLGTRYLATFAKNGVKLDVRESDGSIANFKALTTPGSGVDAAFVQGGLIAATDAAKVLSVGRVAYEPLWVFTAGEARLERLADLKGKRVLVGPAGGGTNALAVRLLASNGITAGNATLINRALPDYVDMLAKGEADAGFLVLAPEAQTVQRLLRTTNVRLMSFANADAYTQKFPFLAKLELREGVIDLGARIPPADTTLIATTAAVLVRPDAHHALVNLLAQALQEAHGRPSVEASGEAPLFQRIGEFPTAVDPEFTMSDDAKRVYRAGAPFLQRYVPFWLATMIDRMMVSALVALPLLIPLMRFAPQIYRWRVRRRILHWYGALKALEAGSRVTASGGERTEKLAELDRIEAAVDKIPVPLGFSDQLYDLRQHVDAARRRLSGANAREAAEPQA